MSQESALIRTDSQLSELSQNSNSINPEDLMCDMSEVDESQYETDHNKLLMFHEASQSSNPSQANTDLQFSPIKSIAGDKDDFQDKKQLLENFPPGLTVFHNQYGLKHFKANTLHLEKHFDYTVRNRLASNGVCELSVEHLLCSPVYLSNMLQPSSASSILIRSQNDFSRIANFLFFSITVTEIEADREVLLKAFFDLLLNYGYNWKLTAEMIAMVLENFRVNRDLMFNDSFFTSEFKRSPPKPTLYMKIVCLDSPYEPIMILNTLSFFKEIICRGFFECSTFSELKMVVWMLFVCCQHRDLAYDGCACTVSQELMAALLDMAEPLTDTRIVEIALLLSVNFKPIKLAITARNWTPINMSLHLMRQGHNHPLNYMYALTLVPQTSSGVRIRTIMAFLSAQVILGVDKIYCPSRVLFSCVWDLLKANEAKWDELKNKQTAMRAFVCILDSIEQNVYTPLVPLSSKAKAFKGVYDIVDSYLNSLPKVFSDELDSIQLQRILYEIVYRWQRKLRMMNQNAD